MARRFGIAAKGARKTFSVAVADLTKRGHRGLLGDRTAATLGPLWVGYFAGTCIACIAATVGAAVAILAETVILGGLYFVYLVAAAILVSWEKAVISLNRIPAELPVWSRAVSPSRFPDTYARGAGLCIGIWSRARGHPPARVRMRFEPARPPCCSAVIVWQLCARTVRQDYRGVSAKRRS